MRRCGAGSRGRPYHTGLAVRPGTGLGANARAVSRRTPRVRRRVGPAEVRIAPHLAGGAADPRLRRTRRVRRARVQTDAVDGRCAPVVDGRADVENAVSARATSFYYSFLALPADKRDAIIAVWDFCRAVDDAVDEPA